MALSPPVSIGTGLAVATLVYAIHSNFTPTIADVRSLDAHNADITSATRAADWTAAGVVAGISLMTKDATVFVIGGVMVVAMSWLTKHANQVNPTTKKATTAMAGGDMPRVTQAEDPGAYQASMASTYDAIL